MAPSSASSALLITVPARSSAPPRMAAVRGRPSAESPVESVTQDGQVRRAKATCMPGDMFSVEDEHDPVLLEGEHRAHNGFDVRIYASGTLQGYLDIRRANYLELCQNGETTYMKIGRGGNQNRHVTVCRLPKS